MMVSSKITKGVRRTLLSIALCAFTVGCSTEASQISPFSDGSPGLGERNTNAIAEGGGGKTAEQARHALEVMGSYRRAHAPQPYYPVIRPAEVRLMWIPDHLNRYGDLVPAHYYYLRVLNDGFAVQDAFEIEQQLNQGSGRLDYGTGSGGGAAPAAGAAGADSGSTATPWIYKEGK